MSASNIKPGSAPRGGQGVIATLAPSGQSILLDKLNVRRSTPDSEALASSDDEPDNHRQDVPQVPAQPQRPVRRASWLNDTSQATLPHPRKGSFAGSSMSPTTSHPSTPSAETGAGVWAPHSSSSGAIGRGHQPPSFPWGTGIWTSERKEPPSRLTEVLPSPTSTVPAGQPFFNNENPISQTSPTPREQGTSSQIPFAIPLHPTPKTYRSQSYSVGQLDPESTGAIPSSAAAVTGRARPVGPPGLQHRPSRPSMLSEMSSEGAILGKVKEVEDDEESASDSAQANQQQQQQQQSADAKTIEMLTRENALLRQQQQYQNSRIRPRASTAATYGLGNGYSVHDPVPEESDYAVDELDEMNDGQDNMMKRAYARRMSEYGGSYRAPYPTVENRKLENVKRAFWQSSLGFGGLADISQSRRHSFADVPTRQPSISSMGEAVSLHETTSPDATQSQEFAGFPDSAGFNTTSPVSYYPAGPNIPNAHQTITPSAYSNPYQPSYGLTPGYPNRPPSPHRSMYGMSQPRHNQLLHIVLFKCSRADVFYIQEGTGLTVKPGDLVIVEADRGTDLGTVARESVDWQTAKDLKEHYAEEHYKWLVMYSQNAAVAQEGAGAGLMAASNGLQGSAIGGMGPPSGHHMQEANSGELKPKMIKRLAQSHEIHGLREKEGNEAKAKRMCMQKVKEHGLNMEILDAEFQMDWKKLTFYYFADSYINFNSLVTDLFKIYKTRIWMSAINPASFASPTLGLQAPSGVGPGAVGLGRAGGSNNPDRRANQPQEPQATFANANPTSRSFQPTFTAPFAATDRPSVGGGSAYPSTTFPYSAYGSYSGAPRATSYLPGMMQTMDAYSAGFPQNGEFPPTMRTRFSSPHDAQSSHDQAQPSLAAPNEWVSTFQGLSLNTR
ncbi:putative psp1 domain-containing protein [Rosellinia necatrix]|uniref:Putative psp1 domain-containing protein n=1 Tax=Rosellinia necatrix TaxID=77044 RepID=A0A1S7UKQ0_ROSNE|nr:putative psp1 domain-containing protein [Rosellinia necatrix]